ncbi:hypothetical protein QTP86_008514 [Hemibagrus guttatus]|nr:hypothetical protein QTP86_008514 [Hemibagrus guttatus]
MKLWERVVEARLRKVVEICEQQYGFMPRKSTTDAIFALRILTEKYRDGQRELHCVFVDFEKAYDRVPREELWYCMRKSGVAEKYVRVVQDMYERSRTVVRCAVGQTEEFNVEVGLHQGSALSPFLFAIVMDQLSEEVRQESPWTMMFADDIVICSESREQVEENLERWRFALERRGMKVSRSKTEYMCVNEREGGGTVRLQGEEVKKVQEFKYLGSTVQSNGQCGKEVKKRVQAGWNGWRKVSGVLCDRKISARIKGKVYRTVVRPAMLYGLETVSLRKRQESELEVAELKMLSLGSVPSSKSQMINNLINEKHNTFFHRNCKGSSRNRLLMDGVEEIAWYCPSGKSSDHFSECIAFCNLHGDSSRAVTQRQILTSMTSVNVILLPKLDENDNNMRIVEELCNSETPLIVVLTDEEHDDEDNEEAVCDIDTGKYRVRLKSLNQSDVSVVLRDVIKKCLSQKHKTFNLEKMTNDKSVLKSLSDNERKYFLSWTGIFLDEFISEKLSAVRLKYYSKWTEVLALKKNLDKSEGQANLDKLKAEQSNLEKISEELNAANFGLEHIMREMGQIYEASVSEEKIMTGKEGANLSYLPKLAAELMISGNPMELMDGDTAYVPLTWVSDVLDEVIKTLGDQRVFVLSVLGIQSSGKSTMLNAMFGLQFAVSAGRCTRGAFMQLVRVSKDKKKDLMFDYILVVDTEGLRSSELSGNSIHHDNELSTFVVGLGNMTLINIFGENPTEMQEILQIVVHAFLRMKQVSLNPSCMFVHQNVSDIAAKEKIMDGRRHLQDTLDKMTKLAAKDEDYYTENFSDVIAFDVERDVKYFAQLWEGSPPMASPNPCYSENIQELKRDILSRAANSNGLILSQFQNRVKRLWKALLDENFVLSQLSRACGKKKNFLVWKISHTGDLSLYVFKQTETRITELHRKYEEANDPVIYFEKKKVEYFNIFLKYWEGATSAAILGDQVCSKLKEAILQSVYNIIANFVCGQMTEKPPFNGNRADLEKHILKSLAEQKGDKEERFNNYLTYMNNPKAHFEGFIKTRVKEFMAAENPEAVSETERSIEHKQSKVINAARMATKEVKSVHGDGNQWLEFFSNSLADELGDTRVHLCDEECKDSIDYDVLVEALEKAISAVAEELKRNLRKLSDFTMEKFRERPDDILITHFCRCCWEQCPFCGAVCTNSQQNHSGLHNADFHRTSGMNGWHYRGTTEFFIDFCTTAVASDKSFYPSSDSKTTVPYKQYRTAGGKYEQWGISTDFSELAYWKWINKHAMSALIICSFGFVRMCKLFICRCFNKLLCQSDTSSGVATANHLSPPIPIFCILNTCTH